MRNAAAVPPEWDPAHSAPPDSSAALRVVGSPRRREILRLIWTEERSAGEIRRLFPEVTFGAVSQHLRALLSDGFVECRSSGRQRFYLARREALGEVGEALEAMWSSALYRLKALAELAESRRGPAPASAQISRTPSPTSRKSPS